MRRPTATLTPMRRLAAAATCVLALIVHAGDARAHPGDDALAAYRTYKTAPSQRQREQAQFELGVSLRALKLYQSAYGIFSEIADHPEHVAFKPTLRELTRLAANLPSAADVEERVGKYDDVAVEALRASDPEEYTRAQFLRGRFAYGNRRFDEAIRLFNQVEPRAVYYPRAQFYTGLAHIQMRRPSPAVRAFKRVVTAVPDEAIEDGDRVRDLALLSIARTYYSAGEARVAIDYYRHVDTTSEYWSDVMLEQGWAYFAAGDHARALGNVHMRDDLLDVDPESDILRSFIYLANCQWDDAASTAARVHVSYRPLRTEVGKIAFDDDAAFYQFARAVRDGKSTLSGLRRRFVENALSDREFLRHLQYVAVIEDELRRFSRAPASFRESALGGDVKDGLVLARDIATKNAGSLARERLARAIGELDERLRDDADLLAAAFAAKNGKLDLRTVPWRISPKASEKNVVTGDEEHVIWPWTGEIWADEAGSYRQSIQSKCSR